MNSSASIPVVHRLTILYLVLPVVIWLVGWFHWWIGIPAVLLLAFALARSILPSWRVPFWNMSLWRTSLTPVTGVIILAGLAWVMATAAGGVFDIENYDWDKHRAVWLHLSRDDWPVYFTTYFELPLILRYYLGYYMVPGLLGKWLGVAALNWAVPLWTWCGAALMLQLFTRGFRVLPALAGTLVIVLFGITVPFIPLYEGDRDYSLYRIFTHAPQHFIPSVLYSLMLIQLRHHAHFLTVSGVVVATSIFWSPFIAIALLPLVGVLMLQNGIRPFMRWQNLLVAPALALLLASYVSSGAARFQRGWLWEGYSFNDIAIRVTYTITLLLLAILIVLLRPKLRSDPMFLIFPIVLPVFLAYSYGEHGDWPTQALSTPITVLCYFGMRAALRNWHNFSVWYRRTALAIFSLIVVAGSIQPAVINVSYAANFRDFRVFRYERIKQHDTIFRAVRTRFQEQYVIPAPAWLQLLLRHKGPDSYPDRGNLIVDSEYQVYINKKRLAYIRYNCSLEERHTRFILHVVPVDTKLLEGRESFNFDFYFQWNGMRIMDNCIVVRDLPTYEISSITTGQYIGGHTPTGVKWAAKYHMPVQ